MAKDQLEQCFELVQNTFLKYFENTK